MTPSCPNCGCKKYKETNANNPQTTIWQCTECGQQYAKKAWLGSDNEKYKNMDRRAESVADEKASDKPDPKHDPKITNKTRDSNDEPGNDPIMRLKDNKKNKEDVGRRAMKNPFIKVSGKGIMDSKMKNYDLDTKDFNFIMFYKRNPHILMASKPGEGLLFSENKGKTWRFKYDVSLSDLIEEGFELIYKDPKYYIDFVDDPYDRDEADLMGFEEVEDYEDFKDILGSKNKMKKESRDFRRSDWGTLMKEISEKNMTFPENPPSAEDGKSSVKGKGETFSTFEFNPVDRKEHRSSPKRRDLEEGQAEWEDRQVDKYYDGWVADHIENSGGKIIGSNTEKTMNLNDGERRHKPDFPTEAVYEKLLESRHLFDGDYAYVTASNNEKMCISKKALKNMRLSRIITIKELREIGKQWIKDNPEYAEFVLSDPLLPEADKSDIREIIIENSKKAPMDKKAQESDKKSDDKKKLTQERLESERVHDEDNEKRKTHCASKTAISKAAKKSILARINEKINKVNEKWNDFEENGIISDSLLRRILAQTTDSDSVINEDDESEAPGLKKKRLETKSAGQKTASKLRFPTIPV